MVKQGVRVRIRVTKGKIKTIIKRIIWLTREGERVVRQVGNTDLFQQRVFVFAVIGNEFR